VTDPLHPPVKPPNQLRVGPAGWSYPDWAGFVYPTPRSKGFHEATYLSQFFDTIEINTSFYQPLRPEHAAIWIDRLAANPIFLFTAKLWQKFTHEPAATSEDERAVRSGFDVLRQSGKLGAILMQFPFSFHRTTETVAHLSALLIRFSDYPLVVELRHSSWQTPETLQYRPADYRQLSSALRRFHLSRRLCSLPWPPLRHLVHRRSHYSCPRTLQLSLFRRGT
jgi:uncharacterized protein YecE (DUF72 family)